MTSTARRLVLLIAMMMGVSLAIAPAVAAHDTSSLPLRIDLPAGFRPEGIESWGKWLYAGSLADGAIWRANAKTGEGRVLVPGETGKVAVGLHLDRHGRLWVAGGPTGQVRVYDSRDGDLLETYQFTGTGFLNDLDITRNAVYATDSMNAQLAIVPLGRRGALPDPSAVRLLPLGGDFVQQPGFNANGIVARGPWLVMVQSGTGFLFKVHPRTGVARQIDTGGYLVTNGDGLELRGKNTLYAVRNQNNLVAVLQLRQGLTQARLVGEITEQEPNTLSVPTTATVTLRALWVVNARFGITTDEYWITRLPLRPDS
jgi:sugar lactone lactonase YvrE